MIEEMDQKFIIVATSSSSTAFAIGNGYGKPFDREDQAERRMEKLDRVYPYLHFLVLPIHDSGKRLPTRGAVEPNQKEFVF